MAVAALMWGLAEPLASGAAVDEGRAARAELPAWAWRLWSENGWRRKWRHDTVKSGQVWMSKRTGSTFVRRSLPHWRKAWAKGTADLWPKRETAVAWSARTGRAIPDWLRFPGVDVDDGKGAG